MQEFGWRDAIELLIFWVGIYVILRSLKGTRGLGVLKGTATFVLLLYVTSKGLDEYLGISLSRLTFLIESLAPLALVAFVVVFQPEVRRGLTRLGERPFSFLGGRGADTGTPQQIADACGRMARRRRGALIVIERGVGFRTIIEGGVALSAELTGPLLEAIFEPSGPLHDGAVVVRGNTIVAASCLLPLSDDPTLDPHLGTRHRAAIGLSDETDAIVVVVSEETGRISIAWRGRLRTMRDPRELLSTLDLAMQGIEPEWATEPRAADQAFADRDSSADVSRSGVRARDSASGERPAVRVPRLSTPSIPSGPSGQSAPVREPDPSGEKK